MDNKKLSLVSEAVSCQNDEVLDHISNCIIDHCGADMVTTKAMEECAELIQAVAKAKIGDYDHAHIAEEMADVLNCLQHIKNIFGISDEELRRWRSHKLYRVLVREQIEPF